MDWRTLAAAQDGVITRAQIRSAGLSNTTVTTMLRSGALVPGARGVHVVGGAPMTWRARLWVVVLATDGVLCRQTAGRLWGAHDNGDPRVHVMVPPTRRVITPASAVVHHAPPGRVRFRSELPVTDRTHTVIDLLADLPRQEADTLADRALQKGWLTRRDLVRGIADRHCRPGTPQLRRLADRTADGAAAESERVLHRLLRRAGVTGWVANHAVWHDGELIGVLDVAIPGRRLAIEVDGWAYHSDVERFRADRRKQNALVALGWTVLRFTWADLTERPGYVTAMVRQQAA